MGHHRKDTSAGPRGERGRRGGALVYALATVTLVCALAASFLQLSMGVTRRQAESIERKKAFYLAEAGLTEAMVGLAAGRTGNVGTAAEPAAFGEGLFWVEATELGGGLVQLESFARAGGARAELSLVAREGRQSVASLGVFGGEGMDVQPGSLIDAYESSAGPYVPGEEPPAEEEGVPLARVGSNGPVTIQGTPELPTLVHGDVFAGVDETVTLGADATVTGATGGALSETVLPAVVVPDLASAPGIDHQDPLPLLLSPGAWAYDSLHVGPGAEVIVQGPGTLVLGDLTVDPEGTLTLDTTSGPIEVFAKGRVLLSAGSELSVTPEDPTRVSFQVDGEAPLPHQLFASGRFHGLFYAPRSDVEVASSFELFGSLVAGHLGFLGPVQVHIDASLAAESLAASEPSLFSWRIIDLASEPGEAGGDPFVLLGVDPLLSPKPAEAHEDQLLRIQYVDLGDSTLSYSGLESAFDWSQVKEVVSMTRDGVVVETSGTLAGLLGLR